MFLLRIPEMPARFNTSTQMYPKEPEYLVQVYERVMTLGPYNCMFTDLKQETPDNMRLRANILEDKE